MADTFTHILPGFGGRTVFNLDVDEVLSLDLSKCATAVIVLTDANGNEVSIEQSFDEEIYAVIDTLTSDGDLKKFPITDAIGKVRCFSDGPVVITVVGFQLDVKS